MVGYAPTPADFQSAASTKLASSPMVGVSGLEPLNPKELIYSQPQLPLCDTPIVEDIGFEPMTLWM
jgi:hypothetical protein